MTSWEFNHLLIIFWNKKLVSAIEFCQAKQCRISLQPKAKLTKPNPTCITKTLFWKSTWNFLNLRKWLLFYLLTEFDIEINRKSKTCLKNVFLRFFRLFVILEKTQLNEQKPTTLMLCLTTLHWYVGTLQHALNTLHTVALNQLSFAEHIDQYIDV